MSKWIRGIYNAAANFNMRNALQSASGRTMDRNTKHVCEKSDKCDKSSKSCESDKSCKSTNATCTCREPIDRNIATYNNCRVCNPYNWNAANTEDRSVIVGNDVIPTPADYIEREYSEYVNYTVSACREDPSTWVRVSNEPRDFKQSNADATNTVEQSTGIPTGVTI